MKNSVLFQPIKIGTLEIKNRFVMPAMNSHTTGENKYLDRGVAYFTERAKGGFGLVITEFMAIDPDGLGSLGEPGIWDDCFIPSLQVLTDSVHKAGGRIFSQLHHAGYGSRSHNPNFIPKAVSKTLDANGNVVEAYTISEIKEIIEKFIAGAKRAKAAGFDGVEIHGAHGYLISQFLTVKSNKRFDEYGGNYENRFRIAKEIIEGVKRECGRDFPVSFRLNSVDGNEPEDNSLIDSSIYAQMAVKAGADVIHVSFGTAITTYFNDPGFNVENARHIKKSIHVPVIVVGRINDENVARQAIESGAADMVALGRQSICDPHFPEKVYHGKNHLIFRCMACMQRCSPEIGCEEGDMGVSCMINPFTGKELRWKMNEAETPKKIAVIGAGCAGLQSAWILAARGHQVTIYEKSDHVGGNLVAAAMPPKKYGFLQAIYTEEQHCREYGVRINLNTEITEENISDLDADVVIISTGSTPLIPNIPGLSGRTTAQDVLLSKKLIQNKKVAVLGGGSVGVETAEYLLKFGNKIDVIEMRSDIAVDLAPPVRKDLLGKIEGKVRLYPNTMLVSIDEENCLHVKQGEDEKVMGAYDEIVAAMGYRNYNPFAELKSDKEIIVIGDAAKARNAKMAIYEATKLGVTL